MAITLIASILYLTILESSPSVLCARISRSLITAGDPAANDTRGLAAKGVARGQGGPPLVPPPSAASIAGINHERDSARERYKEYIRDVLLLLRNGSLSDTLQFNNNSQSVTGGSGGERRRTTERNKASKPRNTRFVSIGEKGPSLSSSYRRFNEFSSMHSIPKFYYSGLSLSL